MAITAECVSEVDQSSASDVCGMYSTHSASGSQPPTFDILQPVFSELWRLYDRYIEHAEDVPWWYTERSIVGHLASAAFTAGGLAIEEYTHERTGKRPGRADLWMCTQQGAQEVLVECKLLDLGKGSSWDRLYSKLREASEQNLGYTEDAGPEQNFHRLAMCFVRPYWKQSAKEGGENAAQRELWLGRDKPDDEDAYDYCAYYWLNDKHLDCCKNSESGHVGPALLIYCKEIPSEGTTAK